MNQAEVETLKELIELKQWNGVSDIVEKLKRRRLPGELFPVFEPLVTVTERYIYKTAIGIVGKMKDPPPAAFDAVLNAWQSTWQFDCPQCTDYALKALLILNAHDERLIDEIKRCLAIDNYAVHKECAMALMEIASPAAIKVLVDFKQYLPRTYTEKLMINLFEKIDQFLATR